MPPGTSPSRALGTYFVRGGSRLRIIIDDRSVRCFVQKGFDFPIELLMCSLARVNFSRMFRMTSDMATTQKTKKGKQPRKPPRREN